MAKDGLHVAEIVRDAGGKVVGRTRLQKIAYLLELAGVGVGYRFHYRYYGPYSQELTEDLRSSWAFDLIDEQEIEAAWGGRYSIFTLAGDAGSVDQDRAEFARLASETDAIILELAATAAFLKAEEGNDEPWEETARRKPEKASSNRIDAAKIAYDKLRHTKVGVNLPELV